VGSKEAYDPRRGDASRVVDFVVVFAHELLFIGDNFDSERKREYDDNERRNATGIRTRSTDSERDCERTATTSNDDGGPTVHDVPII